MNDAGILPLLRLRGIIHRQISSSTPVFLKGGAYAPLGTLCTPGVHGHFAQVDDFTEAAVDDPRFHDERREPAWEDVTETEDFVEVSTEARGGTVKGLLRRNSIIVARL